MTEHEEALRALDSRDWSGATVEEQPPPAKIVLAGRFRPDQAQVIMAEAERRGVKVSEVLRDLVDEAFAARDAAGEQPMTVRPADVLRALSRRRRQSNRTGPRRRLPAACLRGLRGSHNSGPPRCRARDDRAPTWRPGRWAPESCPSAMARWSRIW